MYDFKGKKALITAGAGGIGRAMAEALIKHGVEKVAILDIDEKVGQNVVSRLDKAYGKGNVAYYKCDIADKIDTEKNFQKVIDDFGGLDIILNNSGIVEYKDVEYSVNVTLTALIRVMELAYKHMGKHNGKSGGLVINTASILGLDPAHGNPIYTACKHGVIGLTKSYGNQNNFVKSNIRTMAICPGVTMTDLVYKVFEATDTTGLEKEFAEELKALPHQETSTVADTIIHMINEGTHGSIWVIEGDETFQVEIPNRMTLKKKLTSTVADTIIHMINEGTHGSIWVIEGDETFQVEIPNRMTLKKKL